MLPGDFTDARQNGPRYRQTYIWSSFLHSDEINVNEKRMSFQIFRVQGKKKIFHAWLQFVKNGGKPSLYMLGFVVFCKIKLQGKLLIVRKFGVRDSQKNNCFFVMFLLAGGFALG